jgi:hypothetical protein
MLSRYTTWEIWEISEATGTQFKKTWELGALLAKTEERKVSRSSTVTVESHCLRAGRPIFFLIGSRRQKCIFYLVSVGKKRSALAFFLSIRARDVSARSTICSSLEHPPRQHQPKLKPRAAPSPMDAPCCMRPVTPCAPPARAGGLLRLCSGQWRKCALHQHRLLARPPKRLLGRRPLGRRPLWPPQPLRR